LRPSVVAQNGSANNQHQNGQLLSPITKGGMHLRAFWVTTEGRKTLPYGASLLCWNQWVNPITTLAVAVLTYIAPLAVRTYDPDPPLDFY
jgi:hypothetical protein